MNNVLTQFHKDFPQYATTKVNVVWVPWTSRTTDWNNALASGKNAPDITELGNTDTPTEASLGVLTNVSSYVNSWSGKAGLVSGMLANDVQNGDVYAVPWFGGVRGVWYRTDQFTKAGITSPPTTWAQLVTDAQKLQQTFPGTYGIDAITDDTNAFASFLWGLGRTDRYPEQRDLDRGPDLARGRGRDQVLRLLVQHLPPVAVEVHRPDRTGQHRLDLGRSEHGLRPGQA